MVAADAISRLISRPPDRRRGGPPRGSWLVASVAGALWLFGALLPGSGRAWAQGDGELARRYFKLGEELFVRSDYEGALEQFRKSYEHSRRPALLFNMARCHESLGRHDEAIKLYREYLVSGPANADVIRARIANLERLLEKRAAEQRLLEAQGAASQPPAPPVPPARHDVDGDGISSGSVSRRSSSGSDVEVAAEAPRGGRPLRSAGWGMLGLGTASVITGLVLGTLAAGKARDLEAWNASGTIEYAAVKHEEQAGRRLEVGQIVGLAVGGALAGAGAVLLVVDHLDARGGRRAERRAWLGSSFGRAGVTVTAGLRF